MKLMALPVDKLPQHIKDAIDHQVKVNGAMKISELPAHIQKELKQILIAENEGEMEDHTDEIPEILAGLSMITSGIADGVKMYNDLSKGLIITFHNEQAKRDGLEMYNACAEFVREWNAMELEHGDCVTLDIKH